MLLATSGGFVDSSFLYNLNTEFHSLSFCLCLFQKTSLRFVLLLEQSVRNYSIIEKKIQILLCGKNVDKEKRNLLGSCVEHSHDYLCGLFKRKKR